MVLESEVQPIQISADLGYVPYPTEGVSSKVFLRNDTIYKLNNRNSLQRQRYDLSSIQQTFAEYLDHIPRSKVVPATLEGSLHACVIQPRIHGKELKKIGRDGVIKLLQGNPHNNKTFISKLLDTFFNAIELRQLYPDIVGYPSNPDFFNAVNLLAEDSTGKIMFCDVGLSPHEDTLKKYGRAFYDSENVRTYVEKMREFEARLHSIP